MYINDNVTVTKGAALIAVIAALIPGVNTIAAITTVVIWLIESDWANEEFKRPW
jgi:hypothetical protein